MPRESLAYFLSIFKSANYFESSLMTCYFGKVQCLLIKTARRLEPDQGVLPGDYTSKVFLVLEAN